MKPLLVGFNVSWRRDGRKKDTLVNTEFAKDFVVNVVTEDLAEAQHRASKDCPPDVSEFEEAGLTPVRADLVKSPMVGESPINMECRLVQILVFGEPPRQTAFIIGEVVRVHIKDELCVNGEIKMSQLKAIGRMGGDLYCRTRGTFELKWVDTELAH